MLVEFYRLFVYNNITILFRGGFMRERTDYEKFLVKTKNTCVVWREARGIAPNIVADKIDDAMLEWLIGLSETLNIWLDKKYNMTTGELILARANLGAIVEFWLRFFCCAYYNDYVNAPFIVKNKRLEPDNEMSFYNLQEFCTGKIWPDKSSDDYIWVDSVRNKRNAVHSFTYRDIGSIEDFICDVEYLFEFVDRIINQLPDVLDCLDYFPIGYVNNINYVE